MAIEIVIFPMKHGGFPEVLYVYQMVIQFGSMASEIMSFPMKHGGDWLTKGDKNGTLKRLSSDTPC